MGQWHFQGQQIRDLSCVAVWWKVARLNENRARSILEEAKRSRQKSPPLFMALDSVLLQLDWRQVPEECVQDILNILESDNHEPIRKYRKLFSEVTCPEAIWGNHVRFYRPVLLAEYWEDTDGKALTLCTLYERILGSPVLLLGDVESVLKIGPASIKEKHAWTQKDSDLLAHFVQVVGQIQRSRWSKSPCRITSCGNEHHGEFPCLEEFVYAAVYFRQLYSDKLLNQCYSCYERFANSQEKAQWVQNEVKGFEYALRSDAQFGRGWSCRALIDCFLYGAGILHSISHASSRTAKNVRRFWQLITKDNPAKLAFGLNGALRQLLGHASKVAIVVHQDYGHWIKTEDIPKPNVYWHTNLFSSRSEADYR